MHDDAALKALDGLIQKLLKEHGVAVDSALYNGGTLLALAASIAATAFPWDEGQQAIPKVLAGVAAFLIGAERALGFGHRWRYHKKMRSSLRSLEARVALARSAPPDRRDAMYDEILKRLEILTENEMPDPNADGNGTTP